MIHFVTAWQSVDRLYMIQKTKLACFYVLLDYKLIYWYQLFIVTLFTIALTDIYW
jgi:hypothetical protein